MYQVAQGMGPRAAWEACGKPKGEAGIQNVRKRGLKARKEVAEAAAAVAARDAARDAAEEEEPEPLEETTAEPVRRRGEHGPPQAGFRLRKEQVRVKLQEKQQRRKEFDAIYVEMTRKWAEMVRTGANGKGVNSAYR